MRRPPLNACRTVRRARSHAEEAPAGRSHHVRREQQMLAIAAASWADRN
jgi:hypothetical protein